jgi:hypothetical protein
VSGRSVQRSQRLIAQHVPPLHGRWNERWLLRGGRSVLGWVASPSCVFRPPCVRGKKPLAPRSSFGLELRPRTMDLCERVSEISGL